MTETAARWAAYCSAHAAACEKYDRDFGPFPGCQDCRAVSESASSEESS